jgi:hypothetical protein
MKRKSSWMWWWLIVLTGCGPQQNCKTVTVVGVGPCAQDWQLSCNACTVRRSDGTVTRECEPILNTSTTVCR